MAIDKSLRRKGRLVRSRNVLTREERIDNFRESSHVAELPALNRAKFENDDRDLLPPWLERGQKSLFKESMSGSCKKSAVVLFMLADRRIWRHFRKGLQSRLRFVVAIEVLLETEHRILANLDEPLVWLVQIPFQINFTPARRARGNEEAAL